MYYFLVWLTCAASLAPAHLFAQNPLSPPDSLRAAVPLAELDEPLPGNLGRRISLQMQNVPLEEILREIGMVSGVSMVFHTDLIERQGRRSLTVRSETAAAAIVRVVSGTALEAYWLNQSVLIRRRPEVSVREEPAARSQTLRGRVFDSRTRVPLPGANVIVAGSDPLIGTTTDRDGRFLIEHIPLGRHDLRISFLGYEPVLLTGVLLAAGREVVLEIPMREAVVRGEEVTITARLQRGTPANEMAAVSARSFTVEETRRYAGGLDDPGRMATAFAGVTGIGPESNALVIRGNAPKGVLWRLEGVEIPNPNHFGGLAVAGGGGLTLFSSQLLADSDFLTSAFPAEYGNAMAGVFDMNLRSGNPHARAYAFQLGLIGIDAGAEGPFLSGAPSTYLFNYRYSTLALIMPALPVDDVIRYQDLSFKLSFPMPRGNRMDVWGIGGLDHQKMIPETDSTRWQTIWDRSRFDLDMGVGAAGISHSAVIGKKTFIRSTLAATANRVAYDQDLLSDEGNLDPYVRMSGTNGRFIASTTATHRFSLGLVNTSGLTLHHLVYDLSLLAAPGIGRTAVRVADDTGRSLLLQAFSQSSIQITRPINAVLGAHFQHFALTGESSLEPRVGLRIEPSGGTAINFGYGLHSQTEDLRIYFLQPYGSDLRPNERLRMTRAHHAVAGVERQLGETARVKLEGYYQYLFNVPVIADSSLSMLNFEQDWTFNEALVNVGSGENYGFDLTAERFVRAGFYYLVTGSLFRSHYRAGDGIWRGTRFDQRYKVDLLAGREFTVAGNNLLGINARLSAVGGKRRSPVDHEASRRRRKVVYDEQRAFSEREPGYLYVDLSTSYRLNVRQISHVISLQVKNLLGAATPYYSFNYETGSVVELRERIILPEISYRVEF